MSEENNNYTTCIAQFLQSGEVDTVSAFECFAAENAVVADSTEKKTKVLFFIYCSSLVFLMQAGFAMICSGCVRKKNVQNTILKNFLDVCGSSIAFFFVGYAFAFGGGEEGKTTFIGNTNFLLTRMNFDEYGIDYAHWTFHFAFAATAATIVAGTLAERCQMNAYLFYSIVLTGFVYPVIVHNVWSVNGYLSSSNANPLFGIGMVDFAGSGVVHVTGGITALIATKLLGPRKGRFFDDRGNKLERPKSFPGHSKSLQMLGTLILWFGWFGFNAGSAVKKEEPLEPVIIAKAVVNTTLAGACSGIVALVINLYLTERKTGEPVYKLSAAMNGCLAGLAAITGSCGIVEPWAALVIGVIAGCLFLSTSYLLEQKCLDDAVDAIPVHLAGGAWGVIATGLFASPRALNTYFHTEVDHVGWFYSWGRGSGDFALIGCQLVGLICILIWVSGIMFPFFFILNYLGLLRSDGLEEIVGLDVSYHGYSTQNTSDEDLSRETLRQYVQKYRKFPDPADEEENDNQNTDRFE